MKLSTSILAGLLAVISCLFVGCETANTEKGPNGTIAYHVQVESSTPGVRIEVNEDSVGNTPLTLTIYGDRDGTFHNFGATDYVIRAFPLNANQHPQTKVFRTGGWFSQEDRIPSRIYFDMEQQGSAFSIDLKPRY